MGCIVPGILLTAVQNNVVILNLRYAVAYRALPIMRLPSGVAYG